jgi:hypothetical protein
METTSDLRSSRRTHNQSEIKTYEGKWRAKARRSMFQVFAPVLKEHFPPKPPARPRARIIALDRPPQTSARQAELASIAAPAR